MIVVYTFLYISVMFLCGYVIGQSPTDSVWLMTLLFAITSAFLYTPILLTVVSGFISFPLILIISFIPQIVGIIVSLRYRRSHPTDTDTVD